MQTDFDPTSPPRPTGTITLFESLDGMILYGEGPHPFLLQVHGGPLAIPVFSSIETAARFAAQFGELLDARQTLKKIDDGAEFLRSVTSGISVIIDCHKTPRGTVKYQEVLATGSLCGPVSLPSDSDS